MSTWGNNQSWLWVYWRRTKPFSVHFGKGWFGSLTQCTAHKCSQRSVIVSYIIPDIAKSSSYSLLPILVSLFCSSFRDHSWPNGLGCNFPRRGTPRDQLQPGVRETSLFGLRSSQAQGPLAASTLPAPHPAGRQAVNGEWWGGLKKGLTGCSLTSGWNI